jgi:hypothetical protein
VEYTKRVVLLEQRKRSHMPRVHLGVRQVTYDGKAGWAVVRLSVNLRGEVEGYYSTPEYGPFEEREQAENQLAAVLMQRIQSHLRKDILYQTRGIPADVWRTYAEYMALSAALDISLSCKTLDELEKKIKEKMGQPEHLAPYSYDLEWWGRALYYYQYIIDEIEANLPG